MRWKGAIGVKSELNATQWKSYLTIPAFALRLRLFAVEVAVKLAQEKVGSKGGRGEEKTRPRDGKMEARLSRSGDGNNEQPVRGYLPVAGI